MRIGQGFDTHPLVLGRKLILGGVEIIHPKGLLGHSDADVLLHAVADSIYGALGIGDIGEHFPAGQESTKDIDSMLILKHAAEMMHQKHFVVGNLDITVICESPRISTYKEKIISNLAHCLRAEPHQISVKGKTTEKLGFTGREEGIAVLAVILIKEKHG
ncbi:MAG: 2-C-methyl-D-erythritol 2,4-cyclodiphosphate synthase [Candidatus Cloacimonetes bacterium]|nr:2-C-methyl-D-erythritol 2,4-cyclodiphosphate synthase [Candidatus Cloacimonadota bacterium]